MENQKYERIGNWNVSLVLPEQHRDALRNQFTEQESGKAGVNCLYATLGNFYLFAGARGLEKGLALEDAVVLGVENMQKSCERIVANGRGDSYFEQRLKASTTEISADPFIVQASYFSTPQIDNHEKCVQNVEQMDKYNVMNGSIYCGSQMITPLELAKKCYMRSFGEDVDKKDEKEFCNGTDVRVTIDIDKREGIIEPSQRMIEFYGLK